MNKDEIINILSDFVQKEDIFLRFQKDQLNNMLQEDLIYNWTHNMFLLIHQIDLYITKTDLRDKTIHRDISHYVYTLQSRAYYVYNFQYRNKETHKSLLYTNFYNGRYTSYLTIMAWAGATLHKATELQKTLNLNTTTTTK